MMTNTNRTIRSLAVGPISMLTCVFALSAGMPAAADCEPHWDTTIGDPGLDSTVRAIVEFDDGSAGGPALYVGGTFTSAGGLQSNPVAKWDGESWTPLGTDTTTTSGVSPWVRAIAVFDDGSGPALYAGGRFKTAGGKEVNHIAKWDGESWLPLGTGMGGTHGIPHWVRALTVFDDGSGPALYAGGQFTTAGGVDAPRIAKWDGESWSPVGTGEWMDFSVRAMTVFDDGTGPALYVGGAFTTIGDMVVNRIAKWDGESWSTLGTGTSGNVRALNVFDDGTGPALYVGGIFNTAGGVTVNRIAKWDGESWSSLGTGVQHDDEWAGWGRSVLALEVFDDGLGDGPALYAGGEFTMAGGVSAHSLAKWDGSSWSAVPGMAYPIRVFALAASDGASSDGPALHVGGGWFDSVDGLPANHIATWRGCATDDEPGIPGDLNGDGVVDVDDLFILLAAWGECADCADCEADLNDDCAVDAEDLFILLANWG